MLKGSLKLWDDNEHGEVSELGVIKKTSLGYRFEPAGDWVLSADQLEQVAAILEALK